MNDIISKVIQSNILECEQSDLELLINDIKCRSIKREFDDLKQIPKDIIEKFRTFGIYKALVPKRFGGKESTPYKFCQLIEAIAEADGSAGWVASFGMSPFYLSGLPITTLKKIYGTKQGANIIFAGGLFPIQNAEIEKDGFKLNGRWKYSSGCTGADIIGVGIQPSSQDVTSIPRIAVIPSSMVEINKTWNTVGLLGTGSHDLVVKDSFVANDWTFIRGGNSNLNEPLFKYPALSLATQVLSAVAIGVARRALYEVKNFSNQNKSLTGAPTNAQKPTAKVEIAKAEASFQALRSFFYQAITDAWNTIEQNKELTIDEINMLRLSSTHAVHEAAKICRNLQLLTGMIGISQEHPIARCVNDSLVITQHAFMGEMTYINAGSILFGELPQPGYL